MSDLIWPVLVTLAVLGWVWLSERQAKKRREKFKRENPDFFSDGADDR